MEPTKFKSTLRTDEMDRTNAMLTQERPERSTVGTNQLFAIQASRLAVSKLSAREEEEVLAFLLEHVEHTFGMIGFIRSNGIVSPHNRGTFYACRNAEGELEGVALIGHATMLEARSDAARMYPCFLASKKTPGLFGAITPITANSSVCIAVSFCLSTEARLNEARPWPVFDWQLLMISNS